MSYSAFAISVMALLFTVVSFWWLHARPGKLRAYEPQMGGVSQPRPLVVIGLCVRFVEGELTAREWTRTRVNPGADYVQDVTAPFSIPGRDTRELVRKRAQVSRAWLLITVGRS